MIINNLKMNTSNSHINSSEQQTISSDADGRISSKKRKLGEESESNQSNEEDLEEEDFSSKRSRLVSESEENLRQREQQHLDSSLVSDYSAISNVETSSELLEAERNIHERAVDVKKSTNKEIIKCEQMYSDSSSDSDESIIGKLEAGSKETIPEAYRESVKFHDELSSSHSSSSSDEDEPHLKVALVRKTQQKIQNMKLKNRKKITKDRAGKKKSLLSSKRRKRNSKCFSDSEDELDLEGRVQRDPVAHYKKLMRAMELRINNYVVFFKDCPDVEAKKNKIIDFMNEHGLEDYLKEHGLEGKPPTISICKKVAIKNRIKNEVAELDTGNIISESGRGRRRNVYSLYSSTASPVKQKEKKENKSRIAFLDVDSSSEEDELQKYVKKFNNKGEEIDVKDGEEEAINDKSEDKSNGSIGNKNGDKEDIEDVDTSDSDFAETKSLANDFESDSDEIGSQFRKCDSISEGESYKKRSNKVESESEEEEDNLRIRDNMDEELKEEGVVAVCNESPADDCENEEVNLQEQCNSQENASIFSDTIDTASNSMKYSEDAFANGTSIEGTNSKSIDGS